MTNSRSSASRKRRVHQPSRLQILAFIEGEKTEDGYLKHWQRLHRDRVLLETNSRFSSPKQMVEAAVKRLKAERADEKRGRGKAPDQVWCVFDCDDHPLVDEAIQQATDNGIRIAFSNPCLEIWFVLHFEDHKSHIVRSAAQDKAKVHLKCRKNLTQDACEKLVERFEEARQRAIELDDMHRDNGSKVGSNPSSGMWRLVDEIRGA